MKYQALTLVTAPTSLPITLLEAKEHLRVDHSAEDLLIEQLIKAAADYVGGRNGYTGRALNTQTWDVYFDEFTEIMQLPLPPLQSVTSIQYRDTDGNYQTLSTSLYSVRTATEPAAILVKDGEQYPDTQVAWDAVKIRCVLGYTSTPDAVKAAIKLVIGDLYQNREAQTLVNGAQYEINNTVKALLYPYRVDVGL